MTVERNVWRRKAPISVLKNHARNQRFWVPVYLDGDPSKFNILIAALALTTFIIKVVPNSADVGLEANFGVWKKTRAESMICKNRAKDFPQDAMGAEGVDKLFNYALSVKALIV